MEIAPARPDDADAVAGLWVELARDQRAYGSHLLAEENRTAVREAVAARIGSDGVLVARPAGEQSDGVTSPEESESRLAGFVMFGPDVGSYRQSVDRWVVQNVYVRPPYRDQGVGSDLLAAAERRMAAEGADAVAVEAMAANRDAIRLYERRGYDPHRVQLEKSLESDTLTRDG